MTDNFERALQERLLARSQVSPRDVEALRLFVRTLPARRRFWQLSAFQWSLSAAAVVLAAVVALPVLFRVPGIGPANPTPTPVPTGPAPTQPAETPGTSPSAPAPTPDLGLGPIRLAVASGSVVDVVISDPDGLLAGAVAEQAEATMSVRWFESIVEATGERSIRLTWVGFPRDEEVQLDVSRTREGGYVLHIVEEAPPPASDGEGEDRVLVLEFDEPVDVDQIEVAFDYPA